MENCANLFLVGPMGAGKTTIGRRLSRALRLRFVDVDHVLEERTGVRIPVIFDIEGEAGFRERETRVIDELSRDSGIVLATGGGAVLQPENRQYLKSRGWVVYLHASADRLHARTRRDRNRPLLQTDNPRARIIELLAERDPLYRECADLTVDTDRQSVAQTLRTIESNWLKQCAR